MNTQEVASSLSSSTNLVVCKVTRSVTGEGPVPASAFTLQVIGNNPSQSSFPGSPPPTCTTITLGAGGFQVREVGATSGLDASECATYGAPGSNEVIHDPRLGQEYCVNFSQGCSGTIAASETKTCTVTNTAVDIS